MRDTVYSILNHAKTIAENTGVHSFWDACFGTIFLNVVSIVASMVTIGSALYIIIEIYKYKNKKKTKALIFKDLIRHFWINNVITFVVIDTLKANPNAKPDKAIFKRMAVKEEDLNFNAISLKAESADKAHQCELKMRNYNITAECLYDTLCDEKVPLCVKLKELDNLVYRSRGIILRIYDIAIDEKLDICNIVSLIEEKYSEKNNKDVFSPEVLDMAREDDIVIPECLKYQYQEKKKELRFF